MTKDLAELSKKESKFFNVPEENEHKDKSA